jgi:hypothetical protein
MRPRKRTQRAAGTTVLRPLLVSLALKSIGGSMPKDENKPPLFDPFNFNFLEHDAKLYWQLAASYSEVIFRKVRDKYEENNGSE